VGEIRIEDPSLGQKPLVERVPGKGVRMWPVIVSIFLATSQSSVAAKVSGVSWSKPNTRLALTIMPRPWILRIVRSYSSIRFCGFCMRSDFSR